MISAIVRAGNNPKALGLTLAPLVRGVVEGLVCDVYIVGPGSDDLRLIAEHAGATLVANEDWHAGFVQARAAARMEVLLIINAGVAIGEATWPLIGDRLRFGQTEALVTRPDAPWLTRLGRRISGQIGEEQVLLIRKATLPQGDPLAMSHRRAIILPIAAQKLLPVN